MNNSKNKKMWMPATIGVSIVVLGIFCSFISKMFPCNNSSCVYSFTGYILPLLSLEVIVPYGISLAVSSGVYYLFDKIILGEKNHTGKDHPFLWSLLLSIILFYPAHELVDYIMYLILFK